VLCTPTKFNNHIISRRFEEQIHKIEITLYCIYFNYNIMNQMELLFTENRVGHGNYYYTMKIENNICTWSCDRWEVQQYMHNNNPPYNIPSYISKSIKELLEMTAIVSQGFTMWSFANKIKEILTVTLKDELDDIILHHVKELKETENKLKDSDNKLKDSDNKLKETENKLTETVDKFLLLQNTHNDLIINNNNIKNNYINDIKITINKFKSETAILNDDFNKKITELLNKNNRIQSNNLEITIKNKKLSRQLEDITELYELLLTKQSNDKLEETENKLTKTENKLKESNDKLEKTENELKESINFYESLLTKQNEKLKETENKLKELYDKQQKDENSGWGILSLFFQK